MLLSEANRLYLRRILRWRTLRLLLLLLGLAGFLDLLRIHGRLMDDGSARPSAPLPEQRVYIASMHFNDGHLLRSHWNKAMLDLTEALGPSNVFVSIFESGSWDDSKAMLRSLDQELERRGVPHRVETSNVMHRDEILQTVKADGWVDTPRKKREPRRIPYLARLRNRTLRDLIELSRQGVEFDKVVFLNDVIFTEKAEDVLALMRTNGGHYAAACSLDFANPPQYYDTFALRDIEGRSHLMHTWPYFKARASRQALVHNLDAVPVASCWNGIVVMRAEPFVSSTKLRFRGIADSLAQYHVEGSECCLIHADNPLTKKLGVFLNPRVRVAYNQPAHEATHPDGAWLTVWAIFRGLWVNRIKRWTTWTLDDYVVRTRVSRWEKERAGNQEPGAFCLINEMQVLVENGWAHV